MAIRAQRLCALSITTMMQSPASAAVSLNPGTQLEVVMIEGRGWSILVTAGLYK